LTTTNADLTVEVVSASGIGNDVSLTTTGAGDMTIGLVEAAGDMVVLSSAGAISDDNDVAADVVADVLNVNATDGVGSMARPLQTEVSELSVATSEGAIILERGHGSYRYQRLC